MGRKKKETIKRDCIAIPRDMVTTPFFTVAPLENRSFIMGNRQWDFNVPLTIEHGAVLYNILSFKDVFNPTDKISFTMTELCSRVFESDSAPNIEKTKSLLNSLSSVSIRILNLETDKFQIVRLIRDIIIEGERKQNTIQEIASSRIKGVVIHPDFIEVLEKTAEITGINLQEFNSIRSKIAKAIYNYLPSRAFHHDKQDPFEINLATLFQQLNITGYDTKSERKKLITQHKESVIKQLDGKNLISGKLRVKLHETKDKKDHKLVTWTDRNDVPPWANTILDTYDLEILDQCNIKLDKVEKFLKKAKYVLGIVAFREILAEEKNKVLEGNMANKGSVARLLDTLSRTLDETPFPRSSTVVQPDLFDEDL